MDTADLAVLEQVGIDALVAHCHRWPELHGESPDVGSHGAQPNDNALLRLEKMGLVAFGRRPTGHSVSLTPAGVEALAYLASSS